MKRIRIAIIAILAVLAGLWFLADSLLPQPLSYFSFRSVFVQFTGVLALGTMSIAMVLALRPRWLEGPLDGLDKMYRLHKWLGITALVVSLLHWWWAKGTKWMVGWGWLTKPERGPGVDPASLGLIEGWFRSTRGLAETVGEWTFYFALVLIVLALVKRFPYHWFVKTHRWLAPAFLLLAWHSMVLMQFSYWKQPVGWMMAVLLVAGSVAALLSLFGRIGAGRKVTGRIEKLIAYPALNVLETRVAVQPGWPGHLAGQFAFVTSNRNEGAHPYTIASAWDVRDPHITFITKALGDHTSRLRDTLKEGMEVSIEGPYGRFDFADSPPRQIWIGAGIGITPFIARMKQRALQASTSAPADLFHPTAVFDAAAMDKLQADADGAGVKLHVVLDGRDPRLDAGRIRELVPDWKEASIWFCGPPAFGEALCADFVAHGLKAEHFHQELFQMR